MHLHSIDTATEVKGVHASHQAAIMPVFTPQPCSGECSPEHGTMLHNAAERDSGCGILCQPGSGTGDTHPFVSSGFDSFQLCSSNYAACLRWYKTMMGRSWEQETSHFGAVLCFLCTPLLHTLS